MNATKSPADIRFRDCPVYWFVRLDNARERRDDAKATEAIRELRRLGVDVRLLPERTA